jgi:hypothetical protein
MLGFLKFQIESSDLNLEMKGKFSEKDVSLKFRAKV